MKGFMNHPDVRQFQLVQNKNGSLTIKFIPEEKSNIKQTKKILASRFKGLLGNSIRIDFAIVEKIDTAPGGKSKLVISNYIPLTGSRRTTGTTKWGQLTSTTIRAKKWVWVSHKRCLTFECAFYIITDLRELRCI